MQLRVHDFAREHSVLCQILAGEDALFVVLLGFMTQDKDNFVPDVNLRVVVVVVFGRRDAVSREDHRAAGCPVAAEIQWDEIRTLLQLSGLPAETQRKRVVIAQSCSRSDLEILKIASAQGLKLSLRKL